MKRKYVIRCSIAFLLILVQADVIDSQGSRGRSRSSSSKSHSSSSWSQIGSSSSDSISCSSDSSSSGLGRRRWESSKSAGSSTNYLQPTQEPFPSPSKPWIFFPIPWDSYNAKPWRPKPSKAKLKHVSGAAVAGSALGAAGAILLGGSMSNMEFHFWDPKEEQWWYEHPNSYSTMVYFQNYDQYPVPEEVFVGDCVNVTVREFIENRINEMEIKVVMHMMRRMCKEEYHESFFRPLREGNSGKIPKTPNAATAVITSIEGISEGHDRFTALYISFFIMLFFLTKLLCC